MVKELACLLDTYFDVTRVLKLFGESNELEAEVRIIISDEAVVYTMFCYEIPKRMKVHSNFNLNNP